MTAKVAPTTVKLGKSVTISGTVTPATQLAGAKVTILVNRKSGTKWVKAKSATATASATGAYSWKYKVTKKGSYQVKISVKATPDLHSQERDEDVQGEVTTAPAARGRALKTPRAGGPEGSPALSRSGPASACARGGRRGGPTARPRPAPRAGR